MNSFLFSPDDFNAIVLDDSLHPRIKVAPMYFNLGFSTMPVVYARHAVYKHLLNALTLLPHQYGFLIWDAYRPRAVQAGLFQWMQEEIRKKMPHLSEEENSLETQKYMSRPSAVGDAYCPPHLSGGAIDLTLFDTKTGFTLNMGTAFDDCSELAYRDYFQHKSEKNAEELQIQEHRHVLCSVMEKVGFTSYQYEWWHFDLGDLFWSRIVNQPAVFGPLFGDNEWPLVG